MKRIEDISLDELKENIVYIYRTRWKELDC